MTTDIVKPEELKWKCYVCNQSLVIGKVQVSYMGNRFSTDLPYCSRCGQALIPEDIALGKMAEVERLLEDK
jgi:hypothetical protein